MGRKLGSWQRWILTYLTRRYGDFERNVPEWMERGLGVPWVLYGWPASDRAARSRALAALERRGLVIRSSLKHPRHSADEPRTRTGLVILTPAGLKLGKKLLSKAKHSKAGSRSRGGTVNREVQKR